MLCGAGLQANSCCCSIDLKEFAALCYNYDDSITYQGIKAMFDQVNFDGNDMIDLEEFYAWVVLCFGECDEQEFNCGLCVCLSVCLSGCLSVCLAV